MSTLLPNYVLACVEVKKIRGLCSQTPAAAQPTALRTTSFTNYPASITLQKVQPPGMYCDTLHILKSAFSAYVIINSFCVTIDLSL